MLPARPPAQQSPCGCVIGGSNDEDLVANARKHAGEAHADWPELPDEELLAMAMPTD